MKVNKVTIIIAILIFMPLSLSAQMVHDLLTNIKIEFEEQNFYTSLNYCRDIIKVCNENPVSECWFTNVMKDVYRYKGLAEFEIYKKELKTQRLESAIHSFEISYSLYQDAEILYTYGYLSAIKSILQKKTNNLDGLVNAWKGILELYGRYNWTVTKDLVDNIKDYIRIAEKFTLPNINKNYTGKFAQYMIIMACNLAEKAQLNNEDNNFFKRYRKKYKKNNLTNLLGKFTE